MPRHKDIVARILGNDHVELLTKAIGFAEIGMAIWILMGIKTRLNARAQILVIATMNALEFFLVPDLLLWGKANLLFALMFLFLIYYKEFLLNKKMAQEA